MRVPALRIWLQGQDCIAGHSGNVDVIASQCGVVWAILHRMMFASLLISCLSVSHLWTRAREKLVAVISVEMPSLQLDWINYDIHLIHQRVIQVVKTS